MIGNDDGAAADFSSSTYGMMSPGDLDLLTRFHPLNERSLLDDTKAKLKEDNDKQPSRGDIKDDTKTKGVQKEVVNRARGGRGRAQGQQVNFNESFIAGQIADLGYAGVGCLSSTESNRKNDIDDSVAVNDFGLATAMKGVTLIDEGADVRPMKISRTRGRGRRIQNE